MTLTIETDEPEVNTRPARTITTRGSYEEARGTVVEMEMLGIPADHLTISARDVRFVDQQTFLKSDLMHSITRGVFAGAIAGIVVTLMLGTLSWLDPFVAFATVLVTSTVTGAIVGAAFGLLWRLTDITLRPLQPAGRMIATRFDVTTEDPSIAVAARNLL